MGTSNTANGAFARNENYQGDDPNIARDQATVDGWFKEIARLHREGGSKLSAEDRLDIIELTHLWDSAFDALDRETWLSLYAEDGVFSSSGFGEVRGYDELALYYDTYKVVFHGLRHLLTNHIIVGEGDEARVYCDLTVVERIESTQIRGTAVFYEQVRKIDGKWKFWRIDQVVDPGMSADPHNMEMVKAFMDAMTRARSSSSS